MNWKWNIVVSCYNNISGFRQEMYLLASQSFSNKCCRVIYPSVTVVASVSRQWPMLKIYNKKQISENIIKTYEHKTKAEFITTLLIIIPK